MFTQMSSEEKRKMFFMNYREILQYLNDKGIKNNNDEPITMKQLRVAINRMDIRHPDCEWLSELVKRRYHYVVTEGVLWLEEVYFNSDKKSIDADIDFFLGRIEWYEKFCDYNNLDYPEFVYNKPQSLSEFRSKKDYLKALEERKMILTRICIEAGLPYNDFFGRN